MTRIVVLGHSHIRAVHDALNTRKNAQQRKNYRIINLRTYQAKLGKSGAVVKGDDRSVRLHPDILDDVMAGDFGSSDLAIVSMIGGNAHNILGLLRGDRPFDFILPEEPDLPLSESELVPYDLVVAALRPRVGMALRTMTATRNSLSGTMLHLESPPPIGDEGHVLAGLEPSWRVMVANGAQLSPPLLRYKLWRLHSQVVRNHCRKLGIPFLPSPPGQAGEDGFLKVESYGRDATHANKRYGAVLLDQIESLIARAHD